MNSPLMQWLNRPQGQTPQASTVPQATGQQPNGMQIANVLRDKLGLGNSGHPLSQFASPFMDWLGKMNFSNRGRTPEGRAAIRARVDAMRANRPQGQPTMQGVAGLPGQAMQTGNAFMDYAQDGPGSTGPGDSPSVDAVASNNGIAQGIHSGLMAAVPSAVTGPGTALNMMGLNELNMMGVEPQLSTNHAGNDVAAHNAVADLSTVGVDAMNTANNAVGDGSSSGSSSASGGVGTGADGSGGNAGDPGGEGNGGTYRKGGYIKHDGDRKLEARKITAHEGEFVMRPEAVQDIGVELLRRLNARKR